MGVSRIEELNSILLLNLNNIILELSIEAHGYYFMGFFRMEYFTEPISPKNETENH
jgi:hypothetical protein